MSLKRIWAVFVSRNYEFFRDKAAFGWNFLFPFLIVAGFAIVFSGDNRSQFKAGIYPLASGRIDIKSVAVPQRFMETHHIDFIPIASFDEGIDKLSHHKIDILIENGKRPHRYWINDSSPKGYVVERIFRESTLPAAVYKKTVEREKISGTQIRYIDWLFPGILGMNMMFSALYSVGFVIVRYRKNGVLKRLKATPVTAFEYLTAQMLSRVFLLLFTLGLVWLGCDLIFSFHNSGSLAAIALVFFMGSIALVSIGLVIACRGTSEEFANGAINFLSWPMMFLSEVWFSLEGSPEWVRAFAQIFPLTHMLSAVRKIMNDGALLTDVMPEITLLALTSLVCLMVAARLFSWTD